MEKTWTMPDDFETVIWIVVSIIAYKLFGWVPVAMILAFHIFNGINEIMKNKFQA